MNFTSAQWEMLVAVSNLFKEALYENSVYDELMVVRPAKAGVRRRDSQILIRKVVAGISYEPEVGSRRSPFFGAVFDSIKLDDTF